MLPRIFNEGDEWFVWKAEELTALRTNAKVMGELCMTAPDFPKQSLFLGLPAKFSKNEVYWCYQHNLCRLVKPIFKRPITNLQDCPEHRNSLHSISFSTCYLDNEEDYDIEDIPPPQPDPFQYSVFETFKEKDFWVQDGSNYGCDFCIYVKEPWTCHASALVWCEPEKMNTKTLIQHVRVAENVHKRGIAAIQDPISSVINYIEIYRPLEDRSVHQKPHK